MIPRNVRIFNDLKASFRIGHTPNEYERAILQDLRRWVNGKQMYEHMRGMMEGARLEQSLMALAGVDFDKGRSDLLKQRRKI
jgi:hypothetical protein